MSTPSHPNPFYAQYSNLIKEMDDKVLSMLRKNWMEAREGDPDKAKWRKRLDESLDERIRLMKARDVGSDNPAIPVTTTTPVVTPPNA